MKTSPYALGLHIVKRIHLTKKGSGYLELENKDRLTFDSIPETGLGILLNQEIDLTRVTIYYKSHLIAYRNENHLAFTTTDFGILGEAL